MTLKVTKSSTIVSEIWKTRAMIVLFEHTQQHTGSVLYIMPLRINNTVAFLHSPYPSVFSFQYINASGNFATQNLSFLLSHQLFLYYFRLFSLFLKTQHLHKWFHPPNFAWNKTLIMSWYHNGQGRSLKSIGPPSPASASSRLMINDMAASSSLSVATASDTLSTTCSSITESRREFVSHTLSENNQIQSTDINLIDVHVS